MLINTMPLLEAQASSEIENILTTADKLFQHLHAVTREGAWEPWLLYMLRAVEETATWTTAKIGAIRTLAAHTTEAALLPHRRSRRGQHRGAPGSVPLPQGARIGRCPA